MGQSAGVVRLRRALAIGIDAAEPSLVRAELNALPNLRRIFDGGTWSRVESPSAIGSGTVWPTFFTGRDPRQNGVHSEWSWDAGTMSLRRYDAGALEPFWKNAESAGVLDVPFAPFGFVQRGFEIAEWGAHDRLEGRTRATPALDLPRHPFADEDPHEVHAQSCVAGARLRGEVASRLLGELRPDIAVIVFTEVHHASHALWHDRGAVMAVLREVDAQIGTLTDAFGDGALLVFSLHGMRRSRGIATLLAPLLIENGFAMRSGVTARSLFAAAKRRTPRLLKKLYYRAMPHGVTTRLAQTTMLPSYDWSRTRAFALPSDQHGWIRINLRGREAQGIVDDYDALCGELESMLRATGEVENIIRTHAGMSALPDLVVHWKESAEQPLASGKTQTGQHAPDGFLIARGAPAAETVHAKDLGSLILATRPDTSARTSS